MLGRVPAVMLAVLTLVSSAWAACAWVLWTPVTNENGLPYAGQFGSYTAFESREACQSRPVEIQIAVKTETSDFDTALAHLRDEIAPFERYRS